VNIAVIPARGGSKRIPRKNIKLFCGKPMIAWSIDAALQSGCFERIIVSTDDLEVAEIARHHGAEIPFMRPDHLADDHTGTIPVVQHAAQWFLDQGVVLEEICCVYATAPFIKAQDIRKGLETLRENFCEYAFSVTDFSFPIQRAVRITPENRVEMFYPEYFHTRSQDLEHAYHDAGQFYWGHAHSWREGKVLFGPHTAPVPLPRYRVQDIDTLEDWECAEWLFKAMQLQQESCAKHS